MILKIIGNLDKPLIEKAVKKTSSLIKTPKNLHIYVLENLNMCYSIKLPRNIQDKFKTACSHKVSFSFKFKNKEMILVYMDKMLVNNQDGLK